MGSTGTGHFSDYQGYNGGLPGARGGVSEVDQCAKAFSTSLEDVSACQYYKEFNALPPANTEVFVKFETRIVVVDVTGIEIGYLPTSYNYLAACLGSGYMYKGVIVNTLLSPFPIVRVDIKAIKPNEQ